MADVMTPCRIKGYWHGQALQHGQSPAASWSDTHVIELEIKELLQRLQDGDRVLDVGCGNGYTSLALAAQRRIVLHGVDDVPAMVEQARRQAEIQRHRLAGVAEFAVADALHLPEPDGAYDRVLSIRVVINLGLWEKQRQALHEYARVLRPGGTLLLSEATLQGWGRLNRLRREWGLPDIPMPWFNNYLDRDQVIAALDAEGLALLEAVNFASTYYVGTRVLKPLLIRMLGLPTNVADPNMEWNRWFAQLPAWGDQGTQELLVFRKQGTQ